jgi:3-ketosteroid 9alpha-monooxygenase subunit B
MAAELYEIKLAGIIQETPDARSFVFEIPRELRETFAYRAGQFLTFEVPFEGMALRRCYSLASAPELDAWPKVTVKRVVDGRISNWFNDALSVGDTIKTTAPEGRFVLRDGEGDRPLMLFGGGSGITPVISLLKTALVSTGRKVKLVYANRDAQSIIFKDELDVLMGRFPGRLEVVHHLDVEKGFMKPEDVEKALVGYETADCYTCGPGPFMDTVEAALETVGVARERRFFERFVSPVDPDRREEAPAVAAPPAGGAPASFRFTFEGKTHDVPYDPSLTLLQAAEKAGHRPPSSCLDGYCGCCMALKKKGQVTMGSREALTDSDIDRGWILTCQSRACSSEELEVDYDAPY